MTTTITNGHSEPQPVTLDDAYAAIRETVEENKRLRAEVKELRRGPAGTIAEAIDLIRDQARDSEGVIDTVRRLIEGQSEPAPTLTPERTAILDEDTEATPRMLAAIQGQARDGETPDQTVERLIRERDELRAERATWDSVEKERKKLATRVADLRTKLHDARDQLQTVLDETFGLSAIMELPELIQAVEREAREQFQRTFNYEQEVRIALGAKVVESTLEAAKRASRPTPALLATIQTAIPTIRAGINALGSSEEDVRQRNAARDSLHALEAAVEGAEPAAVLSSAEVEALAGVAMAAEWAAHCDCEGGACRRDLRNQVQRWISAGRPLASERKEG